MSETTEHETADPTTPEVEAAATAHATTDEHGHKNVEIKWKLPKLDVHKLPGAESMGDLLENQVAHLKALYDRFEKMEGANKERIDHRIDEMARLAHQAVDASLDFIGKMRRQSLDLLDRSASKLHGPVH